MSGGNKTPATPLPITIYVSRKGQSTNLSLKLGTSQPGQPGDPGDDTLIADVEANQVVEWKVDPNPDPGRRNDIILMHVKAADNTIQKYKNSQQLLVDAEYAADYTNQVSGVITGVLKATLPPAKPDQGPGAKSFQNYQIGWRETIEPETIQHWDDPRLRAKS